nr:MAG TPA: hypothetical protein [Caudoviricetes sp.]
MTTEERKCVSKVFQFAAQQLVSYEREHLSTGYCAASYYLEKNKVNTYCKRYKDCFQCKRALVEKSFRERVKYLENELDELLKQL